MPKVTNETGNPLKVIVAYKITVLEPVRIHGEMKVDINEGSGGPISLSSDEVTWVLQYGETQYVECHHTNDIIFSPKLDEEMFCEPTTPRNWTTGKIDPDEHIHIEWVGHWQISNNEGGGSHHWFIQGRPPSS